MIDTAAPEGGEERPKITLGHFDVWYQPCENCGYDTGRGTVPKKGNARCWKCGRGISRDYSARALKPENAHLASFLKYPSGNPGQPYEPFHFINCMVLGLCAGLQPPSGQKAGTPRADSLERELSDSPLNIESACEMLMAEYRTLERELTAAREDIRKLNALKSDWQDGRMAGRQELLSDLMRLNPENLEYVITSHQEASGDWSCAWDAEKLRKRFAVDEREGPYERIEGLHWQSQSEILFKDDEIACQQETIRKMREAHTREIADWRDRLSNAHKATSRAKKNSAEKEAEIDRQNRTIREFRGILETFEKANSLWLPEVVSGEHADEARELHKLRERVLSALALADGKGVSGE